MAQGGEEAWKEDGGEWAGERNDKAGKGMGASEREGREWRVTRGPERGSPIEK